MKARGLFQRFRARTLDEMSYIQGFLFLLMKPRNGSPWTSADKIALRRHFVRIAKSIPILAIFALPGGALLLPLLAWILDRRRASRTESKPWPADSAVGSDSRLQ